MNGGFHNPNKNFRQKRLPSWFRIPEFFPSNPFLSIIIQHIAKRLLAGGTMNFLHISLKNGLNRIFGQTFYGMLTFLPDKVPIPTPCA